MSDIQRWSEYVDGMVISEQGYWVTYADHVEALRQAERWSTPEHVEQANYWYEQGQRDALARAVQQVTDDCIANGHYDASHVYYESDYQLCENCKGTIAAIKGDSDE
jgi:hypothetical protein